MTLYRVDLEPIGRRVDIEAKMSLLGAAQLGGVELVSICGGGGTCEACRVRIIRGCVSPPSLEEQAALRPSELADGIRLACQTYPLSDVEIDIPPESLTTAQRLQVEDVYDTTVLDESHLANDGLGLAVDIGTTKLAAFLVELSSGKTLARSGAMNPQIAYGEDVIARIVYASQNVDGAQILQARLVERLNEMLAELCIHADVRPEQVQAAVLVGNTVMHHLLAGLPVKQLGEAPYLPARLAAMSLPAASVGLRLAADASIYLPPNIAGYVGADHIAAHVSTEIARKPITSLMIDIGTNTEVSLVHAGKIWSCSCASGPAFEGAHIRDGMRAAPGAIERVQIAGSEVRTHTINNQPAVGICGSGILDAVAQLLAAGALDENGSYLANHPLVRPSNGRLREVMLASAQSSGHGRDVVVTRKDVNEIQLAKGAIRTGTDLLLYEAGLTADAIDEFMIAGAFGTYLDLESAIGVGMFPNLPRQRFRQVGNAAGAGARQMLVAPSRRQFAEDVAGRVNYIELTTHPKFTETFVKNILFTL
jgi:uncharacterized 2Fe-2S/4Fe-4S cluster protein (DUF4445 family)